MGRTPLDFENYIYSEPALDETAKEIETGTDGFSIIGPENNFRTEPLSDQSNTPDLLKAHMPELSSQALKAAMTNDDVAAALNSERTNIGDKGVE